MIITLCGSTRFINEFNDANLWLTMNGHIVLTVGSFHHSDRDKDIRDIIESHKDVLDKLHFKKIDMSDAIMWIDIDNYKGESTLKEILHAYNLGKPIYSYTKSKTVNPYMRELRLAE